MPNILYTIFIFPIEQLIELIFVFSFRVFRDPGISIIGLSITVSTLVLPLYMMAERQQQAEREKQRFMRKAINNIKAVYNGDKRYMILSALYRQNNYHPVFALRGSFGLLIQIPFFVAAFHFLSNLEILNGQRFYFFSDLGAPDSLFHGINILPVLMTAINIVSGYIYTKGLERKDKIQVYGITAIFLILLYNSPSGLVLYWTCNDIYNLVKNVLVGSKNAENWIKGLVLFAGSNLSFFLLYIHEGAIIKRLFVVFLLVLEVLFLFLWKRVLLYLQRKLNTKGTSLEFPFRAFILSAIGLFLLIGLIIPSSLIASSVEEFSFLPPFSSPLPYLGLVLLQSFGILFLILCLYFIFSRRLKLLLTIILTVTFVISVINVFIFNASHDRMTVELHFIDSFNIPENFIFFNIIAIQIVCIILTTLLLCKKKKILLYLQCILVSSFFIFGIYNISKINKEFRNFSNDTAPWNFEKVFTFSRTEKNILIIVLDGFTSGFIPYIVDEKPELLNTFKGFTYYPNTVTLGNPTYRGLPGIWGGYYYAPLQSESRTDELYWDKFTEAHQVLHRIFADAGFKVNAYNHPTNSIIREKFDSIKFDNIKYGNINNRYIENFKIKHKDLLSVKDYHKLLSRNFIKLSILKTFPIVLHKTLYDNGDYLSLKESSITVNSYSDRFIDNYSQLYYLSDITEITDKNIRYATFYHSLITHDPVFLEIPYYHPSKIINNGEGPLANNPYYHPAMASILLLSKYFDFLMENNVYDNTRIILVADHGMVHWENSQPFLVHKIRLPDSSLLDYYHPLLMVKDFDSDHYLITDNHLMTNADVPHLASSGLINKLVNPINGKELVMEKENGILISGTISWTNQNRMINENGNIQPDKRIMHVHSNIFNQENWSLVSND